MIKEIDNDADKKSFQFVLKAMSKDKNDLRDLKTHFVILPYFFESIVCATNGSRLHIAALNDAYEVGAYKAITNTEKQVVIAKAEDISYPDIYQFFADIEKAAYVSEFYESMLAHIIRALPADQTVNPEYIKAPVEHGLNAVKINSKITMTGNGKLAIVMPIQAH